jgi:hypothetical protein
MVPITRPLDKIKGTSILRAHGVAENADILRFFPLLVGVKLQHVEFQTLGRAPYISIGHHSPITDF